MRYSAEKQEGKDSLEHPRMIEKYISTKIIKKESVHIVEIVPSITGRMEGFISIVSFTCTGVCVCVHACLCVHACDLLYISVVNFVKVSLLYIAK